MHYIVFVRFGKAKHFQGTPGSITISIILQDRQHSICKIYKPTSTYIIYCHSYHSHATQNTSNASTTNTNIYFVNIFFILIRLLLFTEITVRHHVCGGTIICATVYHEANPLHWSIWIGPLQQASNQYPMKVMLPMSYVCIHVPGPGFPKAS